MSGQFLLGRRGRKAKNKKMLALFIEADADTFQLKLSQIILAAPFLENLEFI